ncbi:transposase [Petroclostridium sp. X23]|uniref:transposase n=1 Tax=Petroclostridium sp. X23 TaxID=3045146 RepID=UPI0024ADC795|nr:transposase [Petroclostridium sp. X23]WHH56940.1 transposase [Petroclostridium sp. X23]
MPRVAREKSSTGIYHIMIRGINQQDIFEDDQDRQRYLQTLERFKKETNFEIYAYCLMNNHVHLLMKENELEISKLLKKIGTSYVYYFNCKYQRNGHLFQDRYKSEAVESDSYFHTVIRYIHQNPVKAGLSSIQDYKWSSYNSYMSKNEKSIVDTEFFLRILSENKDTAIKKYIEYMKVPNDDKCLEIDKRVKLTDEKARDIIKEIGNLTNIWDIQKLDIEKRNSILKKAKEVEGMSILRISRVTGISRPAIRKAEQ